METIKPTMKIGDVEVIDMRIETLKSIAESLKSIDQSLKKIAAGDSEKESIPVKKSYAEKYFTYAGGKVCEMKPQYPPQKDK